MSSKKVPAGGVSFVGWKEIAAPCGLAMTGKAQEIATPCGLAMTEASALRPRGAVSRFRALTAWGCKQAQHFDRVGL